MKIIVPTTELRDIGKLDATLRLPMKLRLEHGMKTICAACGKPIKDHFFIGGFKSGHINIMLHETCLDADEPQPCNNDLT
jgi:hypothetical protein